jgi:hypothetical protein
MNFFKQMYSSISNRYNLAANYNQIMAEKTESLLEQIKKMKTMSSKHIGFIKKMADYNLTTMKKEIDKNEYLQEIDKTKGNYSRREQKVLLAVEKAMEDIYTTFESDIRSNKIENRATLAFLIYTSLIKDKKLSSFFSQCFNSTKNEKDPIYSMLFSMKMNYYSFVYFVEEAVFDYTSAILTTQFDNDDAKRWEMNRVMGGDPKMGAATGLSSYVYTMIGAFKTFMKEKDLNLCYKELTSVINDAARSTEAANDNNFILRHLKALPGFWTRHVGLGTKAKLTVALVLISIITLVLILFNSRAFFYHMRRRRIDITRQLMDQSEMILINIERLKDSLRGMEEGSKEYKRMVTIIEKQQIYVQKLQNRLKTKYQEEVSLISDTDADMESGNNDLDIMLDREDDEITGDDNYGFDM